jgi:hydroxypyruvate reductase
MKHEPRRVLLETFQAALAAVNGERVVHDRLTQYPLSGSITLIAIGKAACAMARGAQGALGDRIADALVITKHGYAEPLPWPVHESGHPLPDAASLEAGAKLKSFISTMPADATVLVLLSGGASALLENLPDGMTLGDLQAVNQWLLGNGLDIHAMNAIRKRLSCIKGGRLARSLAPRKVICFAISDVPGDDSRAIGSGPLVADVRLHEPFDDSALPEFLRALLQRAPTAPHPDDPCFANVRLEVIAAVSLALTAAAGAMRHAGLEVVIHSGLLAGDAVAAGRRCVQTLLKSKPGVAHLWGGETTVVLPVNPGHGGRCQQLALAAAQELAGQKNIWLLAAASDGSDGPTGEAGALVDGETVARGREEGFDAAQSLAAADAGRFLEASGDLVQTGPTGTNVMDLVLGLCG